MNRIVPDRIGSEVSFGRFEPYRVNPPVVRMVAAIPVMAVGSKSDWSNFYGGPGARSEFPQYEAFRKANFAIVLADFAAAPGLRENSRKTSQIQ